MLMIAPLQGQGRGGYFAQMLDRIDLRRLISFPREVTMDGLQEKEISVTDSVETVGK